MSDQRFPGLDVASQWRDWDAVTAGVVLSRLAAPPAIRFFTPAEESIATALVDQLLDQHEEPKIPVVPQIDARLAEQQTDGWHYADMPMDDQAWRDSLAYLDLDAHSIFGYGFETCARDEQAQIVQAVQDRGTEDWHGMSASRVWSLWTRYACSAFYSHPRVWDEIGFSGPAYPRGYKNLGIDAREGREVRDARPADDPVRSQ